MTKGRKTSVSGEKDGTEKPKVRLGRNGTFDKRCLETLEENNLISPPQEKCWPQEMCCERKSRRGGTKIQVRLCEAGAINLGR